MYLFFQDMEDDGNRIVDFLEEEFKRIVDFLINFWVSIQISFLKFYKCFAYVFGNLPWRQFN